MFSLDQSITEWRQQMIAGGIKSSPVLDELESHLRDHVEEQLRAGSTAEQGFEVAVQCLGQPAALEKEFEKVGETKGSHERVKHVFFALAGIPNHLGATMNTTYSNVEPRWATYCKSAAFVLPAVCLWLLSIVFLIPKLEQISAVAGGHPLPAFIRIMIALTHNGLLVSGAIILVLVLLEWRVSKWPRYRRAVVGLGTFVLNAVVLISIFMMVVTAILVAPALMHGAK